MAELTPEEFTDERLGQIFRHIAQESGHPERYRAEYFMPEWQSWMRLGFARTWELPGAVLGGLFTKDLYSGQRRGLIMFWAALPSARATGRAIRLLKTFEYEAKKSDCKTLAAVAHGWLNPSRLISVYKRSGYEPTEFLFSKPVN